MFLLFALLLLLPPAAEPAEIQFEDIMKNSGLLEPLQGMMGHAAAWGDLDNDGLPDLFAGGFCDRPDSDYAPAKRPIPTRLFRNAGNGKFQLIQKSPTEFYGRTSGAVFADLDNDGFPELYVANNPKGVKKEQHEPQATAESMRSKLFKNKRGKFVDVSDQSGASPADLFTARNIGVFDYNNDGLLDLFVVEDKFKKGGPPRSILLKNMRKLRFQIANSQTGIPNDIYGLGLAIADLNQDGRPDFFVSHSNRLFLSQPGNKYREAIELDKTFQWDPLDSEDWPCGAVFGDLNRDGNPDLVLTAHHDPARNRVFLNRGLKNGILVFEDVTGKVGLAQSIPTKSPHVEIQDFDNDGWPDIYISAAWKDGDQIIPLIYHNEGTRKDGLPHFAPLRQIKSPMIYFPAGPTADFDRDGRLDIFLVSWSPGERSRLLKNQTKGGNWLEVQAPIGSKIKLTSGGKLIGYQELYIGFGFASGQLPICHFGLGAFKPVDLQVTFPDGKMKKENRIKVNRLIQLKE